MEQMTEIFMSMMEAKAKRDAPEIQRKGTGKPLDQVPANDSHQAWAV